jgi:type VI secretion system protein ImpH
MGSHPGAGLGVVEQGLYAQPSAFEFAQAIALLERIAVLKGVDIAPLGTGADREREAVSLAGPLKVVFGFSQVTQLSPPNAADRQHGFERHLPAQLETGFFGLGGADGPLPHAYQEWMQRSLERTGQNTDTGLRDLLNMFQHRLLSMLYRAQCRHRLVSATAPPGHGLIDRIERSLLGLPPDTAAQTATTPASKLRAHTAVVADRRRSLLGFTYLLRERLGYAVHARPFTGEWLTIGPQDRTRIGLKGQRRVLGRTAMVGRRVWDEHAGITLTLGPMSPQQLDQCLPGGVTHTELRRLIDFHLGPTLEVQLRLRVEGTYAQKQRHLLTCSNSMRLGWTAALGRMETLHSAKLTSRSAMCLGKTASIGHHRRTWYVSIGSPLRTQAGPT